jgi:branched-chain amino acid transport system substrate-binding protein
MTGWTRYLALAAIVGLGLLMGAPEAATQAPSASLLFGGATSLSGQLAEWGQEQRNVVDLWAKRLNAQGGLRVGDRAYRIETKFYDTQSDPTKVAALVERLITVDKVNLLFGPVSSLQMANAQPLFEKYRIPAISSFAFVTDLYRKGYKYSFSAQPGTAGQYVVAFDMFKELGVKTLTLVAVNNPLGGAFVKEFSREAEAHGIKIIATEVYPPGTSEFSTILTKLAAAKPDLLAHQDTLAPAIELRKQQVALGIKFPLVFLETGPNVAGWEASGNAGVGVISQSAWDATFEGYQPDGESVWGRNADFVNAYRTEYGKLPTWTAAVTANATEIYTRALRRAGTTDAVAVRDAIAGLTGSTFYGPIRFDAGGLNEGPGTAKVVVQWQQGKRVVVYPAQSATGKLVFPLTQ